MILRCGAAVCVQIRLCLHTAVCVLAGCGCQLAWLGDDDGNGDEDGAVGFPTLLIVKHSRV